MRVYRREKPHPFCGHWNGSPVEIGLTDLLYAVPPRERLHYHDYCEYYVVLRGKGTLCVESEMVELLPETVIMVEPREKHKVARIDAREGLQCLVVKHKSLPQGRIVVGEATEGED
jgi:mannose-6-phosphate isomerase-like protein (cupin superfamily)